MLVLLKTVLSPFRNDSIVSLYALQVSDLPTITSTTLQRGREPGYDDGRDNVGNHDTDVELMMT